MENTIVITVESEYMDDFTRELSLKNIPHQEVDSQSGMDASSYTDIAIDIGKALPIPALVLLVSSWLKNRRYLSLTINKDGSRHYKGYTAKEIETLEHKLKELDETQSEAS